MRLTDAEADIPSAQRPEPVSHDPATVETSSRSAPRRSRRRVAAALALVVAAFLIALGLVAVVRYGPLVDDAMAMRRDLRSIASRLTDAGPQLDASSLAAIRSDTEQVKARHARIAEALIGDPLVGLAGRLPVVNVQVQAANDLVEAAGLLLAVMDDGLDIASRFIEVRDQREGASTIEGFVGIAAEAQGDLLAATARMDQALALLDRIPDEAMGPIRAARDEARELLDRYRPVLGQAVEAAQFLPPFLGWDRPKRYLVLAQDPAELRPTGGYIGQYGIVEFDRGRIVEKTFRDIATLYDGKELPYVEPPAALRNHLLGRGSWRLADANWSPDFPTAARQAATFYDLETDDKPIDGVIGLTTYAIDELLGLTGPIDVLGYDITIEPGDATFGILAATRDPLTPGGDRKAILGDFADLLLKELYGLPPGRWAELPDTFERIRAGRLAAIWLREPALQEAASNAGWDGALPVPAGDELVVVEANVGPASKLHLVTDRVIDLEVTLDEAGNAHHQLTLAYNNHITDESADARTRRMARFIFDYQRRDNLGVYIRLLVPLAARLGEVRLDAGELPIGGLEAVEEELGRRSFGAYALVRPGTTTLQVAWVSPGVVVQEADGRWRYQLSVPKPAGRLADSLRVKIHLPPGARGAVVPDATLKLSEGDGDLIVAHDALLRSDVVIEVQFEVAPPAG